MLFLLPVLELLWVNMHIYFIFGPFLIGVFLFETLVRKDFVKAKSITLVLTLASIATLISPYGLAGALYPFTIFRNYGYTIVENQSIHFLQNYGLQNASFLWYYITTGIVVVSSCFVLWWDKKKFSVALSVIALTFAVLAFWEIRNITVFALVSLPVLAYNFSVIRERFFKKNTSEVLLFFYILISFVIVISTLIHFSDELAWNRDFGLGLSDSSLASEQFIKATGIQGPIFNNYDIGGAMIFSFFPAEKVFVDNRPEAYPAVFFHDVYEPMQENSAVFQQVDNQYHFNAIYFYRLDLTPWAQQFLNRIVRDSAWAPVYVDSETIILLKRNAKNASIISKYELPQSMFITDVE